MVIVFIHMDVNVEDHSVTLSFGGNSKNNITQSKNDNNNSANQWLSVFSVHCYHVNRA